MQNDENAQLQEQINRDLAEFGRIMPETERKIQDLNTGIKNSTQATQQAIGALAGLKNAVGDTITSVYKGAQGADAFAGAADGVAKAADSAGGMLISMGGPVAIVAGIALKIIGKLTELSKTIAEQADAEFKGYQKMSQIGAATAKGMTGVFEGAQKLGIGVKEIDNYVAQLTEHSKDLAAMSGSVGQGREQFEDITKAMEPFRMQLQNAGLDQEEQNAAVLEYIGQLTRSNRIRGKSAAEVAEGAKNYLLEQDKLSKSTGTTRKEREENFRAAQAETRYEAKLRAMELEGDKAGADRLRALNAALSATNPELAEMYRHSITGNLDTEKSQQFARATMGEGLEIIEKARTNAITADQAVQQISSKVSDTYDTIGIHLGKIEQNEKLFGSQLAVNKARLDKDRDFTKAYQASGEEGKKQGIETGQAVDKLQQEATELRLKQQQSMLDLQKAAQATVPAVSSAMHTVAQGANQATGIINDSVAASKKAKEKPAEKPPVQPPAKPAEKPPAKPAEKPPVQPPAKPAEKPPATPAEQPPAKPAEKPPVQPPAKPAEKPPATPAEKPPAKPAEQPPAKPAEKPPAKPAEQPAPGEKSKPAPSSEPLVKKISSKDGIKAMLAELERQGIVDPVMRAAIMAQSAVETLGFQFLSENLNYSVKGLKDTFTRLEGVSDATLKDAISLGVAGIGELIYGGSTDSPSYKFGKKNLGNTQPGDGAKFRGRGFIQLTGRSHYARAGAVDNPEKLLDINTAATTAVDFAKKFKGNFSDVKAFTQYVNGGQSHVKEREEYYKKYLNDMPKAAQGGVFQAKGASRNKKQTGFEIPLKNGSVPVNIVGGMMSNTSKPDSALSSANSSIKVTRAIAGQLRAAAKDVVSQMQIDPNTEIEYAIAGKLAQLARAKQTANSINQRLLRSSMN